jgi:integrase
MQKLTATAVKQAKPKSKAYKLSDGGSLYLLVNSQGKYWRYDYRFADKRKTLAIGVYPDVSLKAARETHQNAREGLASGIDPNTQKQAERVAQKNALANSFEVIALEWLKKRGAKSEGGDKRLNRLLQKDLFPYIGKRPISRITSLDLLKTLRRIESRGAIDTAHRAKQIAGMVFRYAVATGRAERDPSVDLKGALAQPKKTHFKSITEPNEIAPLIVAIQNYQGTPVVMAALKLSPLLFCRPGELRHLEWSEVKFKNTRIELPAEKMKVGEPHIIPLSTQAIEILKDLHLITGRGQYVFPSARGTSRPLSDNGVRTALRTLGYTNQQISPHGFRAMARTVLDEILNFPIDWIEHQLAHAVKDPNGRAYNRTKHISQRQQMMQTWADYLDDLAKGLLKNTNAS